MVAKHAKCKKYSSKVAGRTVARKIKEGDQHSIANYIEVSQRKVQETQAADKNGTLVTSSLKMTACNSNPEEASLVCGESTRELKTLPDTEGVSGRRFGCLNPVVVHFKQQPLESDVVSAKVVLDGGQEKQQVQMESSAKKLLQKENRYHERNGGKTMQKVETRASRRLTAQSRKMRWTVTNENSLRRDEPIRKQGASKLSPLCALQENSKQLKLRRRKTLEDFGFAHREEKEKCSYQGQPSEGVRSCSTLHPSSMAGRPTKRYLSEEVSVGMSVAEEGSKTQLLANIEPSDTSQDDEKLQANIEQLQFYSSDNGGVTECIGQSQAYVDDRSAVFEKEIKSARAVRELRDRHLKYLFYKFTPDMEGIMNNKICSWRNNDYHKGGKAKRMLTYKVYPSAFSHEQIDLISEMFIDEYAYRRKVVKYLIQYAIPVEHTGDYLNQVLLPEFLVRVYMATHGTSHKESDKLMAATPPVDLFDVPTHL